LVSGWCFESTAGASFSRQQAVRSVMASQGRVSMLL
jgi:hypothetical protein